MIRPAWAVPFWGLLLNLAGGCAAGLADAGETLKDAREVLPVVCATTEPKQCDRAIAAYDAAVAAYSTAHKCRGAVDGAVEATGRLRSVLAD